MEKKYMIVKAQRLGNKKKVIHKDLTDKEAAERLKQYANTRFVMYTITEQLFQHENNSNQ